MWRILEFITRYGNFLLFVLLEVVALWLVINLNPRQKNVFEGISLEVTGYFHKRYASITGYFDLANENRKLTVQNEMLGQELDRSRQMLMSYKYRVPYDKEFLAIHDSLLPDYEFDFIPCRAINHTYDRNYNYLTLNRGRRHGIHMGMGIISPEGVVGVVIGVSQNYSRALSLLNKNTRISARQLNKNNVGAVTWNGGNPRAANLEFIPQTATLKLGDTIVTSGYSTVFPEKFIIGFIESFDKNNHDGFYNIKIELAANFLGLDNLYIVQHLHQTEIDSLENLSLPK